MCDCTTDGLRTHFIHLIPQIVRLFFSGSATCHHYICTRACWPVDHLPSSGTHRRDEILWAADVWEHILQH